MTKLHHGWLCLALACTPKAQETDAGSTGAEVGGSTDAATTSDGETAATPGSEGGEETGEAPTFDGACPLAERVGGFTLSLEDEYSAFSGVVADGVVPITVLEEVGAGGGCVLLRRNNPVCDPPCQPGTTCDYSGECIAYPQNHDVGVVRVSGLVQPVEVTPVMATKDYFDTTLMHPAFAAGSAIALTAEGGDFAAFSLDGEGVAMIEPASGMLTMKKGEPLRIAWAAAEGAGQVHVELTIDQHGNTPVKLVCDAADTGSLEVPSELVAQFIDFGISGFPNAQYYRQTADRVTLAPGCVEFLVRSHHETLLAVEGHTPCNKPADCPDGQICDILIQTCKDP